MNRSLRIRGIALVLLVVLLGAFAGPAHANGGNHYSSVYNTYGTSFTQIISGPPNTCGTLDLYRTNAYVTNDHQVTPGWACTDGSGNVTKGPWTATTDETADHVVIRWPDGTPTNEATHISDVTAPTIASVQRGGGPPTAYNGTATDAIGGAGFNFTPFIQTSFIKATYRDTGTNMYWDGSCYCGASPGYFVISPSSWSQYSATWAASTLPPTAHTHSYQWCVKINDNMPYYGTDCITFTA